MSCSFVLFEVAHSLHPKHMSIAKSVSFAFFACENLSHPHHGRSSNIRKLRHPSQHLDTFSHTVNLLILILTVSYLSFVLFSLAWDSWKSSSIFFIRHLYLADRTSRPPTSHFFVASDIIYLFRYSSTFHLSLLHPFDNRHFQRVSSFIHIYSFFARSKGLVLTFLTRSSHPYNYLSPLCHLLTFSSPH